MLTLTLLMATLASPQSVPPFDWELTVENRKTGEKTTHKVTKQLAFEVGNASCEFRIDEPTRENRMRRQEASMICWSTHQGRKSMSMLVFTRPCIKAYTATKEMNRWFNDQENGQSKMLIQAAAESGEIADMYFMSTRCLK